MELTIMSSYRKTMAEALQEVSDKNKLKVLARKIKRYKDKVFKKTMSTIPSPLFADNELYRGTDRGRRARHRQIIAWSCLSLCSC